MASWIRTQNSGPYETAELIVSGIMPIILIVVGTFGNLISIIILLNKENRRTSTNIYLMFLCLMDTISLYQWNLSNVLYTFTNGQQNIWGQSLFMCKLSQFVSFYTLHTSAMFLTFVELDRACLLRSTWYKRKIAQARVAFTISVVILLILFTLNGFLFGVGFEYSIYNNSTGIQQITVACYYSLNAGLNDFFSIQYPWIHLVVMYFLPFTVMIVCILFTVKKLIVKRAFTNNQFARNAQRNSRISIMLLLMCLTYMISTLPNRLCFSVFADQIIGHDYTDTIFLSSNTLMYTRNAMNAFFLYISVYGFRRDIRNLVLRAFGKRPTEIRPINTRAVVGTITAVRGKHGMAMNELPVIMD